jgi:hypothetical protein
VQLGTLRGRGRRHVGGAAGPTGLRSGTGRDDQCKRDARNEYAQEVVLEESVHLFRTPTGLAVGLALKELARPSFEEFAPVAEATLVPPFRGERGFGVPRS